MSSKYVRKRPVFPLARAIALYQHHSLLETARMLGYTSRSVSRQLKRAGVKMRPPGCRVLRGVNGRGMPTLYSFSKES